MRPTLLQYLRCPDCGQDLVAEGDTTLRCRGCARTFPIRDGAPRFVSDVTDTQKYFGYIWGLRAQTIQPPASVYPFHRQLMYDSLGAPPLEGLVLDGGSGDGEDLALMGLDPKCEVIGVEYSSGGVATTLARIRSMARAHVIQGDLLRVPLASAIFDGAYSYGVVHHTPDPARAVREIARTLKPGAPLYLYVYEDFSDRSVWWRLALAIANSARWITTRMPPPMLMALCRLLSPVVYVCCTLPSRRYTWAARMPYRHCPNSRAAAPDLYDRLSPPIEQRYSRQGTIALVEQAGLEVTHVAQQRGWMIRATRRA
jgi:SAM-dependent methyltransferase